MVPPFNKPTTTFNDAKTSIRLNVNEYVSEGAIDKALNVLKKFKLQNMSVNANPFFPGSDESREKGINFYIDLE